MEEHGEVQGRRKRPRALRRAARRAVRPHAYSHPFELRRKAVQLCLEEGFPVKQVARELGVASGGRGDGIIKANGIPFLLLQWFLGDGEFHGDTQIIHDSSKWRKDFRRLGATP